MPDEDPKRPEGGSHPGLEHLRHGPGGVDALPIDPDLEADDPRAPSPSHHPHSAPPVRAVSADALFAVFLGGALGTAARDGVESIWQAPAGHFPTATFAINTSGTFLLGVILTVLLERFTKGARLPRRFLCTGVLGGWTTYSSLVIEADALAKNGHVVLAAGYVAVTLVSGIVAAALGIGLGRVRRVASPGNAR